MVLSVLGFKLLVMMYWDGKSAIPLDFSLHREKGKKEERPFGMTRKELKRQYSHKRIKDSYTARREEELDTNKIQMVMRMFFTAIYRGLHIDYVLVDSWFTCNMLSKPRRCRSLGYQYKQAKAEAMIMALYTSVMGKGD